MASGKEPLAGNVANTENKKKKEQIKRNKISNNLKKIAPCVRTPCRRVPWELYHTWVIRNLESLQELVESIVLLWGSCVCESYHALQGPWCRSNADNRISHITRLLLAHSLWVNIAFFFYRNIYLYLTLPSAVARGGARGAGAPPSFFS